MKKLLIILLVLLSIQLHAGYIVYRKGAPGVVQYWYYADNGVIYPILKHNLNDARFYGMKITTRPYRGNN